MELNSILIVSKEASAVVTDAVFETGYVPIVRSSLAAVVRSLGDGRCDAVVVDRENATDIDALECALNVRDVDADIRIFVLGSEAEGNCDASDALEWKTVGAHFVPVEGLRTELRDIGSMRDSSSGSPQEKSGCCSRASSP